MFKNKTKKDTIQRLTYNAHTQCNQCNNMKKGNRYKGQVTTVLLTQWVTLIVRFDFMYFLDWSRGWELTQNKYGYTSSKSVQLDEFSVLSIHREYSRESFTE